ncbi:hypothetical protein QBC35DRAFT_531324 [Podospora australis]|uniref:DUF6594 domain-containing protein n=1 Tax=Podospora australis TaxID=1536484 RepID=A0AAN6WWN9_9PEZI|nr:hypothetical protein QBC35DRAFT_531324 [Podospora australis]
MQPVSSPPLEEVSIEDARRANGYADLGKYIAYCPEKTIFRGFRDLYAENLLYLQAEVVALAKELRDIQRDDRDNEITARYHSSWRELRESERKVGPEGDQFRKILQLRKALNEYYDSLFRYEKILHLSQPRGITLKDMGDWMEHPSLGNIHIYSRDGGIYEKETRNAKEMVSLDQTFDDILSFWVFHFLGRAYHKWLGWFLHRADEGEVAQSRAVFYDPATITRATRMIVVTVACALPTVTIIVLLFTPNQTAKLGVIFAMSLLFAWCMSSMSPAKTQEIFAVTAAFAAVCVVFVSTEGGGAEIVS